MITAASLKSYTHKDLAQMAKKRGVTGWHAMRKDELVRALIKASKSTEKSKPAESSSRAKSKRDPAKPARAGAAQRRIQKMQAQQEQMKDIASSPEDETTQDKIIVMVRDPYWLQAELGTNSEFGRASQSSVGRSLAWSQTSPAIGRFTFTFDGDQ